MSSRPAVPMALERELLVEAGHRCAIPTCRQVPVELAHIEPWAKVKQHAFDNMIALCPTCHTRFDAGQIDRKAMRQYKANLTILNVRYGDLERRVLNFFASNPHADSIQLPGSVTLLMYYLVEDGLVIHRPSRSGISISANGGTVDLGPETYLLTPKGHEFIERWIAAKEID